MTKSSIATLTLLLFAAALLVGQHPPKPPSPEEMVQHRVSYLTTVLSLTNMQQQQATTIFTNAAKDASTVHDSLRSAHESLSAAVKSNDNAAIEQAAATIGNLIAQLTAARAKGEATFYQILTADQQNKMTQLEKARGPFFTDFGFGAGTVHVMEGPGGI
jgi:Spy/CpxP family protein refolding chaperone